MIGTIACPIDVFKKVPSYTKKNTNAGAKKLDSRVFFFWANWTRTLGTQNLASILLTLKIIHYKINSPEKKNPKIPQYPIS